MCTVPFPFPYCNPHLVVITVNAAITHDCFTIFPGSALLLQLAAAPGPCTGFLCIPTSFHMPLPSVLTEQISFPIQGYPIVLLIIYSYKKEVMKQTKEKGKKREKMRKEEIDSILLPPSHIGCKTLIELMSLCVYVLCMQTN